MNNHSKAFQLFPLKVEVLPTLEENQKELSLALSKLAHRHNQSLESIETKVSLQEECRISCVFSGYPLGVKIEQDSSLFNLLTS